MPPAKYGKRVAYNAAVVSLGTSSRPTRAGIDLGDLPQGASPGCNPVQVTSADADKLIALLGTEYLRRSCIYRT